jgi:multidrug efflux pump subunit AcrA (membrane-fusion protein)
VKTLRRSAFILAAVLVGAVSAYGLVAQLRRADADGGGGAARRFVVAPVERRTLRDVLMVRGMTLHPVVQTLKAAQSGRVTKVAVAPGQTVEAGTALLEVDGVPIVALTGERPLWRELSEGSEGPDVEQLEKALAAAGRPPGEVDERFTATTARALKAWKSDRGLASDGVLRLGDVLVAQWPLRAGAVKTAVGDFVGPGTDLVELTSTDAVVSLELSPSERARLKVGDSAEVELGPTRARAQGTVSALADAASRRAEGAPFYTGTVALSEPPPVLDGAEARVEVVFASADNVLAVPVAAVVLDGSGSPAVRVPRPEGGAQLVRISTGLQAGAFVEVRSGLSGGESIVIEAEA